MEKDCDRKIREGEGKGFPPPPSLTLSSLSVSPLSLPDSHTREQRPSNKERGAGRRAEGNRREAGERQEEDRRETGEKTPLGLAECNRARAGARIRKPEWVGRGSIGEHGGLALVLGP